jgi:hypothetical protein
MFVLYSVCVVRYWSLWRVDHPSRGVLPPVVCVWVWSSENKNNLYTCCEQVGRRGKDYETKRNETDERTVQVTNPVILCQIGKEQLAVSCIAILGFREISPWGSGTFVSTVSFYPYRLYKLPPRWRQLTLDVLLGRWMKNAFSLNKKL